MAIAGRRLRSANRELLERQQLCAKDPVFAKVPLPAEQGFKLVFDMLAPRNPKIAGLQMEDVFDASFVRELAEKGFFK